MLSHSKLTSSRILPCLVYLKTKSLKKNADDMGDLKKIKAFMLACLNFYIEKYNMFDNILSNFLFWVMTALGHDRYGSRPGRVMTQNKKLGHDRIWVMTQIKIWVMTGDPDHDPFL